MSPLSSPNRRLLHVSEGVRLVAVGAASRVEPAQERAIVRRAGQDPPLAKRRLGRDRGLQNGGGVSNIIRLTFVITYFNRTRIF